MRVSIAIPFYNAEPYLGLAIQSVLNQTYSDFELLLINDGSTDRSLDVVQQFRDPRIRLVNDGENRGLPARLNQSVQMARGQYYARMDGDDIMHPQRISRQLQYLEEHPKTDVVGTHAYTIDTHQQIVSVIRYDPHPDSIDTVLQHHCFIHPSIMTRRQWLIDHPYDERAIRMEDFNLWLRTIRTSTFANIESPLMFYRTVGLPYLSRYLQSMAGERREVRNIKKQMTGYTRWLITNYAKCAVYAVASTLHLTDLILRRRAATPLSEEERDLAESALRQAIMP